VFVDEVKIKVVAWKWGDWIVSWRREKCVPNGGPWGGHGGHGWNVYLRTNPNLNTLSDYRHRKIIVAEFGGKWGTKEMHGANGEHLFLDVPVGTIVRDNKTWEKIVDLDVEGQVFLIAKWWRGWFGNSHFTSSTRQAPSFAELWDIWEEKELFLELKLVADIWIIWVPSAWKSTLISNITQVKAKIGDYPFTTLTPNLWVLDHKGQSLVLEDVPGLIPWASKWKWLWIQFLKHIERTTVILHLLDLSRLDQVFKDYEDIRFELWEFSETLTNKEEIIVFSKADLLDKEMFDYIVSEFKTRFKKDKIFVISAATRLWIPELVDHLIDNYTREIVEVAPIDESLLRTYDFTEFSDPKDYVISYLWDMTFEVNGKRIEQIVRMTDFKNLEAALRVLDVLDKIGAMKKIESKVDKLIEERWLSNDFFFEWSDSEEINPKVIISWREIKLDKLKFNL